MPLSAEFDDFAGALVPRSPDVDSKAEGTIVPPSARLCRRGGNPCVVRPLFDQVESG